MMDIAMEAEVTTVQAGAADMAGATATAMATIMPAQAALTGGKTKRVLRSLQSFLIDRKFIRVPTTKNEMENPRNTETN